MGYTFRELRQYAEQGRRQRTYQQLQRSALPRLLRARYGPRADEAATAIQRMWRRHGPPRVRALRGPLAYARELAANAEDPCSLLPVHEIPLARFWSFICSASGRAYGWDVVTAHRWFCTERRENPFDRRELPPPLRAHLVRCHEASLRVPRVRGMLRREHSGAVRLPASDRVFQALEQWYGLVYPVDTLRSTFYSYPLRDLGKFYRELRHWILHYGPKHPGAAAWLHAGAEPRHRTLQGAREFVMSGFWRLWVAVDDTREQGALLLTLGQLLRGDEA